MERGAGGVGGANGIPTATGGGGDWPLAIAAVPGEILAPLDALKSGTARPPTVVRVDAAPGAHDSAAAATTAAVAAAEFDSEGEGSGYIMAGHPSQLHDAASEQGEGGTGLPFMALLEQKLAAAAEGAAPSGAATGGGAHAGWSRCAGLGGGVASMEGPSLASLLTPPSAAGAPSRHFSGSKFLRAFGKKLSLGYSKAPRASAADPVALGR
jgi:hypothetical protein